MQKQYEDKTAMAKKRWFGSLKPKQIITGEWLREVIVLLFNVSSVFCKLLKAFVIEHFYFVPFYFD